MSETDRTAVQTPPVTDSTLSRMRRLLSGPRGLMLLAVIAIAGGATANWGWLVAAGIAPIILGVLPCLAMCALGLCANKLGGGQSCGKNDHDTRAISGNTGDSPR